MKKTAFDLDGTIIRDPLGITKNDKIGIFLNNYLLYSRIGKFCYQFFRPNKKVKRWINNRKKKGEEIIIVSGTNKEHLPLVEKWLNLNKIPYDRIFLNEKGVEIAKFKAKILSKLNCDFYVDNDLAIALLMVQEIIKISGRPVKIKMCEKRRGIYVIKLK